MFFISIILFLSICSMNYAMEENFIDQKDRYGNTALNNTISDNESLSAIQFLLNKNANPNIKDRYGDSPIHLAQARNRTDIVKTLLEHGAEVNKKDRYGDTALHRAVDAKQSEIIKLLLMYGADKSIKDRYGNAVLSKVLEKKDQKLFKIFQEESAPKKPIINFYNSDVEYENRNLQITNRPGRTIHIEYSDQKPTMKTSAEISQLKKLECGNLSATGNGTVRQDNFMLKNGTAKKTSYGSIEFSKSAIVKGSFNGFDLSNAIFEGVDASGVYFGICDLSGANFESANLTDADLSSAIVNGTNFRNATGIDKPNRQDLEDRGANFE